MQHKLKKLVVDSYLLKLYSNFFIINKIIIIYYKNYNYINNIVKE